MKRRRVAGFAVLSLLPVGYFATAMLFGQLTEALIGIGVAVGITVILFVGMDLILGKGADE